MNFRTRHARHVRVFPACSLAHKLRNYTFLTSSCSRRGASIVVPAPDSKFFLDMVEPQAVMESVARSSACPTHPPNMEMEKARQKQTLPARSLVRLLVHPFAPKNLSGFPVRIPVRSAEAGENFLWNKLANFRASKVNLEFAG